MPPVTLILHNARVLTMDPRWPAARAVAVTGDRIVAVGGEAEIAGLANSSTVLLDCARHTLLPGFIDAHCHILAAASSEAELNCAAGSVAELVEVVRRGAESLTPGAWLRGRGYHEANLRERRHPNRHDLDGAADGIPIRLVHSTGHASSLNTEALARLGIDSATEEPPGGSIDRDPATGEPTGVVLEMEDWLDRRMPSVAPEELEARVRGLSKRLLAAGITSVQDLGHRNNGERALLFRNLIERGVFRPRITLATGYEAFESGDDAVAAGINRGPVKIMLNETGGTLRPDPTELARRVCVVQRAGRQVAIHAIEPRAIGAALDAIEAARGDDGRALRHRIEHASITPPQLAERMARLGTVVVSNPAFVAEHGDRYLATVPSDQVPHLYDVAGLHGAGVHVAAGSDCPVAPPEPALGILAARNRKAKSGHRLAGRLMNSMQALELFTSASAYAAHEEQQKGRLAPGMLADLVVVDMQHSRLRPALTVLGGEIVWRSPKWSSAPASRTLDA